MAGPNQPSAPGYPWRPWQEYVPINEDRRQRQLDKEMNVYDAPLNIEDQVARYQGLSDFLKAQIAPNVPGGWDIQHQMMNNAPELIRGNTNFSQRPYDYYDPRVMMESLTTRLRADPKMDKKTQGEVRRVDPDRIYMSPNVVTTLTSNILAHEGGHTPQTRLDLRERQRSMSSQIKAVVNSNERYANVWAPLFSEGFNKTLLEERGKRDSPYYLGSGFGETPDETMSYFMGREAELPAGKTLMDDPYTREVFKKHPGMYDEYTKSKMKLRAIMQETKPNYAPR